MNKRQFFIIGILTFLLVSIFIWILVEDNYLYEQEVQGANAPDLSSSYEKSGYFKIDPKTILASLESGNTHVFMPLSEGEALDLEATDLSIDWTQADFLKIASVLGRLVWDDPMDLKDWSVYLISFQSSCSGPIGFVSAIIAYFRTEKNNYVTRMIEIKPSFGWVRWGGEGTYPQPILRKWRGVNLAGAKVTADDALQIVNDDVKMHFQSEANICGVWAGSSRQYPHNWQLHIVRGPLEQIFYTVDFYTGEVIRNTK
jgi:hypothetical protein